MTKRKASLGELETLVLLAVLRLREKATAQRIRDELSTRAGREISRGALYATISRLERKGYLGPVSREVSPGGAIKLHFTIKDEGLFTLRDSQAQLDRMREGLETILGLPK